MVAYLRCSPQAWSCLLSPTRMVRPPIPVSAFLTTTTRSVCCNRESNCPPALYVRISSPSLLCISWIFILSSDPYELHRAMKSMYNWNDVAVRTEAVYRSIANSQHPSIQERVLSYVSSLPAFVSQSHIGAVALTTMVSGQAHSLPV